MARIFLAFALMASSFGASSCTSHGVDKINLPSDVASITEPFIAAVKRGDTRNAEKRIAPSFVDDSRLQFDEMSALLKDAPPLVPALYVPKQQIFGPNENEVSVSYIAQDGKQWFSAEIRMYRPENGEFEIEYWDVKIANEPPPAIAHVKQMRTFTNWLMGGIGASALIGLALLFWIVKRRTHIIAPNPVLETRRVAAIVRDAD